MKKYKFGLLSVFLLSGFLFSSSVVADYTYRIPSFGLGANSWSSFHFYYSEGDTIIIQWFVVSTPESVDFMILDKANYSSFVDELGFEPFYLNNNSFEGLVVYKDIPEDLYFMVFTNDQSSGMNVGFQFSLVEADTTCNCTVYCNCTYTPAPSPAMATISGFVTLTFGLATITAILVITRKIKMKKI